MLNIRSIDFKLVSLLTGLVPVSLVMASVEDNAVLAPEFRQGTVARAFEIFDVTRPCKLKFHPELLIRGLRG